MFSILTKYLTLKHNIMKVLKGIGQILASLVYTPLYTGIMYLVIVLPTIWIITLSFWKMLLAIVVLGGIIEALITLLQALGLLPYSWITKNNKVAYVTSIILCVVLPLYNIFKLWSIMLEYGTLGIIVAIILSGLLLQFVFVSLFGIYGIKTKKKNVELSI